MFKRFRQPKPPVPLTPPVTHWDYDPTQPAWSENARLRPNPNADPTALRRFFEDRA